MLVHRVGYCEKNGNPNKTVEIDERKFGWRKYHKGHIDRKQWAFGGDERCSGSMCLVPVPDRTAGTLMHGSKQAQRSSVFVWQRTAISTSIRP